MAASGTTTLNGLLADDAEALRAWLAFLDRIGGGHSLMRSKMAHALAATSIREASWDVPCRWPSGLTGDPKDDEPKKTDHGN